MKHISLFSVGALFLFASCTHTDDFSGLPTDENSSMSGDYTATIADGLHHSWAVDNQIILSCNGLTSIVTPLEVGSKSILSDPVEVASSSNSPLYGTYPANNFVSADNESVTVAIPETQTAGTTQYDANAVVSIARTTSGSLSFYSVGGGITLNFQMSGVTKVELESVDGYALAGKTRIKWDSQALPFVDTVEDAKSIITFSSADESGFVPGTNYYISTLPCDVYGGYRLSIFKDGLVAHFFSVHQTIDRAIYITPNGLVENELEFDDPDAPLVEEERPELDAVTSALLRQYQSNSTEENKQALLEQMGFRYDKVVARKKAKLRELEREAKTSNLIAEMQAIVDEMVTNRDIRLEQQFLRLIDPRVDVNPNDAWLVLRGSSAPNAYIGYAPVTNAEYALFKTDFSYNLAQADYPVVNISIAEALAYCNWLMTKDSSHTYRLPSDDEWILAAGHMPKDVNINSGGVERGLTAVDAYSLTTGACGGIDFWGNCWEWTSTIDANGLNIIKGGSWDSERDDCRSEKSDIVKNGSQGYANVGFRVVRDESTNSASLK